eukprot:TRINITY_DN101556_c0_g1_i1.p2 TRINITY_DN101556_c0_g1~~TRINITY_DN101556_c0_g1_i1.p2  ORF type:complete len:135 (-),score=16.03 TRINITY_DN101556_c0_g1_i1:10-414(-)
MDRLVFVEMNNMRFLYHVQRSEDHYAGKQKHGKQRAGDHKMIECKQSLWYLRQYQLAYHQHGNDGCDAKVESCPEVDITPAVILVGPGNATAPHDKKRVTGGIGRGDAKQVYQYEIGRAVQQECRDRSRMPSSA